MPNPVDAIDYLKDPATYAPRPVCVVFGDEAFLKHQVVLRLRREVLGEGEGDFSLGSFDGPTAAWRDVLDELATVALFGGGMRLVVVHDADRGRKGQSEAQEEGNQRQNRQAEGQEQAEDHARGFVARYRSELEEYVARPKSRAVLVLEMASWPANTRLYRAVGEAGLAVAARTPTGRRLDEWLVAWAKQSHGVLLSGSVAEMIQELVGPELGLLDQELAKLASAAGVGAKITPDMVRQMVGNWRERTAWEMLDSMLDGNLRQALGQLDRLLLAGEHPIAILGQISATLRRLAAATRLVFSGQRAGRRIAVRDALAQAGIKDFVLAKAERQLRRLGPQRGAKLYPWLLEADLHLKGASALPPRTVLERLVVRLATERPD
jgi:DNA polymerase-3 subunit delta